MLKCLDITVWKLRYPVVLNKTLPFCLLAKLRLLIISNIEISLNDLFIQDIIRCMRLHKNEVHIITSDQINSVIVPKKFLNYCWWLGVEEQYTYDCLVFNTPSLSILKNDINAKSNLWNQINLFLKSS